MNKDKKLLFGIGIVFLFLATVSFTYAYFTATIVNKDVKNQVVQTGTLELTYTDGPEINIQNMKPGNTITKTITVKNTGSLEAKYNIIWQELTNEITNDEMLIEGTCTSSSGTCESIESSSISDKSIKKNISIASGVTHTYNLTITFKDTNTSQNYNQGKKFNGVLGIEEYKKESIYCTFNGELTQGAEYVNGQYTYRYMQESNYNGEDYIWSNIDNDGWGVALTDRTSTKSINSELCTYINDKPVVSMRYMFAGSKTTSLDLSNFNTSNVTNMSSMFYLSNATSLDLSSFDTGNVINMNGMFFNSSVISINGLENFDTSNVIDMGSMFRSSGVISLNLLSFNTSNVIKMSEMFNGTKLTSLDLSSFDTSNVTNMQGMFYSSLLKTIYVSNKFSTSKVTQDGSMFNACTNLVGGAGTKYDSSHYDKTYARIDGGTSSPGYFTLKQ